ncbi:uncharacterized protein LOC123873947 isoform X2 [Maniola jurtina]|uniref:uncharacterized protein LOC123873947 isoform X2 n=1 Tax=Maniola jurtina TaxID=191418 RepID=UPI001E6860DB|nr:uncharacterized protein LOC123873947 isoform X2 [Maniola jurtina]
MDQKLWLLVEWVDEQNVFSNYGVVKSNTLINYEPDLHTGKLVFIRDKHNNVARKGQIIRVSDNKNYVKELKLMLERQDNQVKNVLSLCMNTIKEMKTGSMFFNPNQTQSISCPSGVNALHHQAPEPSTSDSDTDQEVNPELNMTKATLRYSNFQPKRSESVTSGQLGRLHENTLFNNRRSLVSSTPLPERVIPPANILGKLLLDQGTQTDPINETSMDKLEQLESVLHRLYTQFITLVSDLHINEDELQTLEGMSVRSDHNTDDVREESATERQTTPSVELDSDSKRNVKGLQVRRASAQTTNTGLPVAENVDDMVSLGSGNVTVPARLMSGIDWSSYTSATRHLLQAVFPRKILATHSLSGKQSPAFKNKPPKKLLEPQSCITTKCTDEAKMYRNRQHFKKMRDEQNRENLSPPSPASSNESSNPRD